ncbi:MAG: LPS export ABC transporter periplasmic protein LptC [Steroidobacteraceae bacterium]
MIFRVLVALLFLAIIAGSFWLGGEPRETTATTTVEPSNAELGYSARNAVLVETGADGFPMYTLNANVVRQHPNDGVEFEQVQMSFRDADGQTWKGRADRGELTTETGKVDLTGNVHVTGLLPGSTLSADLATEKLTVDTHENIISTREQVSVSSPGRLLNSKGLLAMLKEHQLVLESNVRGAFTP